MRLISTPVEENIVYPTTSNPLPAVYRCSSPAFTIKIPLSDHKIQDCGRHLAMDSSALLKSFRLFAKIPVTWWLFKNMETKWPSG